MPASSTTTFEVAGTDSSQFDQLILIGSVALDGTAQITFDNFTPELSDTFQVLDLTDGTTSSWFSSVVAPEGWTFSSGGSRLQSFQEENQGVPFVEGTTEWLVPEKYSDRTTTTLTAEVKAERNTINFDL